MMAPLPPPSVPAEVSAALTTPRVQVTSGFQGARIVLYGAVIDPRACPCDVVVLVRGPEQSVRIARKVRVAGLWLNSRPVEFRGAPGFYMAASTRPLKTIASPAVLSQRGAGLEHLPIRSTGTPGLEVSDQAEWRAAIVRLKTQAKLYNADPEGVTFVDQGLFKSEINLPTAAPIGRYRAEIMLFRQGQAVATRSRDFTVEKVGFERLIYLFAHGAPWVYGLVSVAIALGAGWVASTIFRRV